MARYCSVPGCEGTDGFRYRTDPQLRRQWQAAIKRVEPGTDSLWEPKDHSVVCHSHFSTDDFKTPVFSTASVGARRRRYLKPTAVPSIFSNSSRDEQEESSSRVEMRRGSAEVVFKDDPDDPPEVVHEAPDEEALSNEVATGKNNSGMIEWTMSFSIFYMKKFISSHD